MARVYESMSSRAAKHAGTLIVLPVANRAFAHCRSNHEDWLPRALWHESSFKPCLNGLPLQLGRLVLASSSRSSISGMINGAKSTSGAALGSRRTGFTSAPLSAHFLPLLALASLRLGVLNMKLFNS